MVRGGGHRGGVCGVKKGENWHRESVFLRVGEFLKTEGGGDDPEGKIRGIAQAT